MKKTLICLSILLLIVGCSPKKSNDDIKSNEQPVVEQETQKIILIDENLIGTYLLYMDDYGSQGLIFVFNSDGCFNIISPEVGDVLKTYTGTYTAENGRLECNINEPTRHPLSTVAHRVYDYEIVEGNVELVHTDKTTEREDKTYYTLKKLDVLELVGVK